MANPFVAEIRIFAGNFAPANWSLCNGQLMAISSNTALFSLLGTFYGGNGTSNFALPNLQGMVPMHWGNGAGLSQHVIGETSGTATVTVLSQQVPQHNHVFNASSGSRGEVTTVTGNANADEKSPAIAYAAASNGTIMNPNMITPTPASLPHDNMQPYLCLSFIIARVGVFPARN
jgi:microcystin-dependent protein